MKDSTQFHIRPARPEEAGLFYAQHPEENKRLGAVGCVRMDFGRSGNEFWHTWWPRGPEELNSPAFKAELQQIVGKLREDVLKSRFAMERFCYNHGGKIDGGYVQNYEERTRTVTAEDGTETEESYTVAIPVADIAAVYGNLENVLHLQLSEEQKSNADSVYNLVRYGVAEGSEGWIPGADVPFIGADGFCSPIGSGWESRVTSEFGNRVDPITGKRKGHGGMDLAVPTGTPIRAALGGTVTVSKYNAGGYG